VNLKFPPGFYFGAATSAHQVEGGNHNDWTEWEKENAERLAKEARQNPPPGGWPDFILNPPAGGPNPLQKENYISGKACDHYNRFEEDFDLAKKLGHNAHRFSIEWSRIEPEEGKFNEKEIERYRKVIAALHARGLEPFVTLWHYTLPLWFTRRGGWLHPDAAAAFTNFVEHVVREYKNEVRFWGVYNEPETFARHGYLLGDRPPRIRNNLVTYYRILRVLAKTYVKTYQAIKKIDPEAQVGISESLVYFEPYNKLPHNLLLMYVIKWFRNNPFLDLYLANSDFIGLQYYFHSRIRLNPFRSRWGIQCNENKQVSDFGWEIYPEGMYRLLKTLGQHKKPIYIMENGLSDARDRLRGDFIKNHVSWIQKAISEGVDVRGYFHWSLLDNFEWSSGFWPRFGLVEVDYSAKGGSLPSRLASLRSGQAGASGGKTLKRKIRPSALVYKSIIERGIQNASQ
jgi:beta-glucosidase